MKRTLPLWLLLSAACAGMGQGTFQNLNFESATVGPDPTPRTVSLSAAFPGWSGSMFGVDSVLYNNRPLDNSALTLQGIGSPLSGMPIAGQYTAALQGGTFNNSPAASLWQTGLVSVGTMSLRFFGDSTRDNFIVSMNGQPLGVIALQDFGNYQEYGADVAAFAGQTVELPFTQPGGANQYGISFLDQISFSPVGVPEPSTWALFVLGSALFWCAARRRRT